MHAKSNFKLAKVMEQGKNKAHENLQVNNFLKIVRA